MSAGHPWHEAVAAYALDALPEEERAELVAHLETCPECRAQLDDLCAVTSALATTVPRHAAPPALRDRVMATVRAEAELLRAAGPEADRVALRREAARPRAWRLGPLRLGVLAGAAALLIAAVLGFVLGNGRNAGNPERVVRAQILPGAGHRASAQVEEAGSRTTLRVAHFAAPGRGRVYQVWLKPGRHEALRATPTLFTVGEDGQGAAVLPASARRAYRVLVSSELAGGSPTGQPTRPPVLQAAL